MEPMDPVIKSEIKKEKKHKKSKKSKKDKKDKKDKKHKRDKKEPVIELDPEPVPAPAPEPVAWNEEALGVPDSEKLVSSADNAAVEVILLKMTSCMDQDAQSLYEGKPAIEKLTYTKQLFQELRNLETQKAFLERQGCDMLAQWISKNQNGHYPCINVIEDTLKLLNTLPINDDHLWDSKIGKVVKKISKSISSNSV